MIIDQPLQTLYEAMFRRPGYKTSGDFLKFGTRSTLLSVLAMKQIDQETKMFVDLSAPAQDLSLSGVRFLVPALNSCVVVDMDRVLGLFLYHCDTEDDAKG